MAAPRPVILLIEDEPPMRRFLSAALGASEYELVEAVTAREGLAQAAGRTPDVILLDLGLPDRDGLAVTKELRGWSDVPIIVLSARGQESDKVAALDAGADDYLTKPFAVGELLARIRVALRHRQRGGTGDDPTFTVGGLVVDQARRRVTVDGVEVRLTPTEYKVLQVLVRHAGRVLTHRQLLREVWGAHTVEQVHNLRVHMAQVRRKIESDPARPRYLLTETGVGYRLAEE
ncbi:MAG TPA: response regulator [Gemmatimonadales bacterium]|nr:response regulator [Gemmatimonadales bacterium]